MRAQESRCAIPRHWPVTARWCRGASRAPGERESTHSALNSPSEVASKQEKTKTNLQPRPLSPALQRIAGFPPGLGTRAEVGEQTEARQGAGLRPDGPPSQPYLAGCAARPRPLSWSCCHLVSPLPPPQQQQQSRGKGEKLSPWTLRLVRSGEVWVINWVLSMLSTVSAGKKTQQ